jgi:hypothetical protein
MECFTLNLSKIIYDALEKQPTEHRAYIGASSIGNPCERAIWYGLNKPESKEIDPKLTLTFNIGKSLESLLIELLKRKELIGSPYTFICKDYPKFQGNADATLLDRNYNILALIEIKTAKDSSFNTFKKKGVFLWMPEYYDQIQSYLGMSEIQSCFLLVINKDSSELHEEVIHFDSERYKFLVAKAKRIGETFIEPAKINESASYFKCKMCFYRKICHEQNKL